MRRSELPAPPDGQMTVRFTNGVGEGYTEKITVKVDMTIGQFLRNQYGENFSPSGVKIRVNGEDNFTADDILEHGDRLSVQTVKVEGA